MDETWISNVAWFYFEISDAGDFDVVITGNSDIDFVMWGPYDNY